MLFFTGDKNHYFELISFFVCRSFLTKVFVIRVRWTVLNVSRHRGEYASERISQ